MKTYSVLDNLHSPVRVDQARRADLPEDIYRVRFRYVLPNRDGCTWYRLELPALMLTRLGLDVKITMYSKCTNTKGLFCSDFLDDADIIITARPTYINTPRGKLPLKVMYNHAQEMGKFVVVDVDDFLLDVPEGNPVAHVWQDEDVVNSHALSVPSASLLTFSTPELAAMYYEKLRYSCPAYVVANHLPPMPVFKSIEKPEKLTIFLTGSSSHKVDWEPLASALSRFLAVFGDRVDFKFQGFNLKKWAEKHSDAYAIFSHLSLVDDDVTYEDWMPYNKYYASLLDAHIILAWLSVNNLNYAKSELKAREAAWAGAYFVGSASPSYVRWNYRYPDISLVTSDSSELFNALINLAESYYSGYWPSPELFYEAAADTVWTEDKAADYAKTIYSHYKNSVSSTEMVLPMR